MQTFTYRKKLKISPTKVLSMVYKFKQKYLLDVYLIILESPNLKFKKIILNLFRNILSNIKESNIYLLEVLVNKNIILKRLQPRAKGRAFKIEKKFSELYFKFSLNENLKTIKPIYSLNKIRYYNNLYNNLKKIKI